MVGIRSDGIRAVDGSRLIIVDCIFGEIGSPRSASADSDDSFVDVILEMSISMISRKRPAANNVGFTYSKKKTTEISK